MMTDLVRQLTQLILQDNAIFFVGNQFILDPDKPPYLEQIADELAVRLPDVTPDLSFADIAQQFDRATERTAFILALKEAIATLPDHSVRVYELLAESVAPYTKIITTRFDQALETALEQAQKSYTRIITDDEVSFFDETRVALIKIHGDINRAKSLVLTEGEIETVFNKLSAVNDVIGAFFATKTMIFMGYDLEEKSFERLFRQVTRHSTAFRRKAYAIVSHPLSKRAAKHWQQQVVDVHVEPVDEFLQKLAASVEAAKAQPISEPENPLSLLAKPPRPDHPYKWLDSFGRLDTAVFAGRRGQITRLANRILARPLTVLYGASGNGKTSLLQAGVGAQLAQSETLLLCTSIVSGERLTAGWMTDLLETVRLAALPQTLEGGLVSSIRTLQAGINGPVVLAVDQFEQFFVTYNDAERETAVSDMRALLDDTELDVRIVLVVREDFLGRLESLTANLPGLLDTRFRLGRLEAEAARNAIEHPVRQFDISWEQALVDHLLRDLQSEYQVAPPQLQIVCTRLYNDALEQGLSQIMTVRYEALGGMAKILGDYVDEVVSSLLPAQQAPAKHLLGAMVSSSQVKLRLSLTDLARAADIDEKTAVIILDKLTNSRLTRRYETKNGLEYELTHDYLVLRIVDWLGPEFWDAQRARELLRLAVPEWQARQRLLPPGDLRLIEAQRSQLNINDEEIALLFASAVSYAEPAETWREPLSDEVVEQVLLTLTTAPQPFVRQRAAEALAQFIDAAAAEQLALLAAQDEDAAVREHTAQALARVNNQPAVENLVMAAAQAEPAVFAEDALVMIRDGQTAVADLLPAPLRQKVMRQVWRRRWGRHNQAIFNAAARGAIGGFLGFGLGMAPIFVKGNDTWTMVSGFIDIGMGLVAAFFLGGFVLSGVFGGVATAGGVFVQRSLAWISDGRARQWAWISAGVVTGLLLALGLMVLSFFGAFSNETGYLTSALAGFMIGCVIALAAAMPLPWKRPFPMLLTIVVGILVFLLVGFTKLSLVPEEANLNSETFLLLIAAGVTTGSGFFWSFNE
jgi:hypothetical protein